MVVLRDDGRTCSQVRPIKLSYDVFGFADSSVLLEMGQTKVQVSVSLQDGVPRFLKGQGVGWLTAEYALLPTSTRSRVPRESTQSRRSARSVEISRLIGRSLRTVTDLSVLGERTIYVDCDVLQADGGTRSACITAASFALHAANKSWLESGLIRRNVLKEMVAAISVGVVSGVAYLDIAQTEDNGAEADFNFVLTQSGNIIEVQGTSEKKPISWEDFEQLRRLALEGIGQIFDQNRVEPIKQSKKPLFSLGNRIQLQN